MKVIEIISAKYLGIAKFADTSRLSSSEREIVKRITRSMGMLVVAAPLLLSLLNPLPASAQFTIAADDGSTYGGSLGNGSSGGYGFNSWSITYGSNTGTFIGSPANNGMGTTNIGTTAWGFYSTGSSGYVNATRTFSQAMAVGDIFTFDWAMNWDASAGTKGFDLLAGGSTIFNINNGGNSTITSTNGTVNTNYGTTPMTVTLTRSSGSAYSFSMTSRSSGGATYSTTISSSDAIDALKIYSGDQNDGDGNRNIYFNNLKITRPTATVQLTGSAGFRLLSAPASTTYETLLGPIWTQGATGADATDGSPNVFTWNTSSTDGANTNWTGLTDLTETITAGTGFLVYVFDDDNYSAEGGTGFPKSLSVTGTENIDNTSPSINQNANGWSLVASPYASTIDFDNVTITGNVNRVAYIWNPNANDWETWNGSVGDITDGLIAPFQAFFVQNASSVTGPSITFNTDDKGSGGTFFGKAESESRNAIRLLMQGESSGNSTWVTFGETGSTSQQVDGDALELEPLSERYARLAARKGETLYDIAHLPSTVAEYRVPLDMAATEPGDFTLSATLVELPTDLNVRIRDNQTGFEAEIDTDLSYTFTLGGAAKVRGLTAPGDLLARPFQAKSTGEDRFELIVRSSSAVSTDGETILPSAVTLAQNYPNPFNPATEIRFSLPQANQVTLRVFDLLGREVAAPLRGRSMAAGWHSLSFDASDLPSGTYVYRLETAAGQALTRQMTLLK